MRARVRRGRMTTVVAGTATWLAPVEVAGASVERFSFIAYLIPASKAHFGQQIAGARDARSSQLPVCGVLCGNSIWGIYVRIYIYAVAKTAVTKNCRSGRGNA